MTTLCTLLGFAPLALGTGEGNEVRAPMAITVIGGLLVSTLLTLVVIPVVYELLDRKPIKRARGHETEQELEGEASEPLLGTRVAAMDIASLSLKRPVSAVMLFVSLMVIGAIAAFRLPLEFFPEVEAPFVFVNIPYPGSTPAEIERTITRPVEEALATISGIERMDSNSKPDGAQIFMQFKWGRSVAIKASEVRGRIDAIRAELPPTCSATRY
jgi:multidrug efflux pump subunit AcrB